MTQGRLFDDPYVSEEATDETNARYTPGSLLVKVRKLGPIVLDPCAPLTNPTGAALWLTRTRIGGTHQWARLSDEQQRDYVAEEGALGFDWGAFVKSLHELGGVVWVNSPWGRGDLIKWATKCIEQARRYPWMRLVILTPGDHSTAWSQLLAANCDARCLADDRIAFVLPDGRCEDVAKFPNTLWFLGRDRRAFREAFEDMGEIIDGRGPGR